MSSGISRGTWFFVRPRREERGDDHAIMAALSSLTPLSTLTAYKTSPSPLLLLAPTFPSASVSPPTSRKAPPAPHRLRSSSFSSLSASCPAEHLHNKLPTSLWSLQLHPPALFIAFGCSPSVYRFTINIFVALADSPHPETISMPPAHPQKPVVGFEDDAPATFQNGLRPHVMRIPELVELIISLGELKGQDLVSLALLCRATRDPALDALWKTLHSLGPLWRLFDTDAVQISHDNQLLITRPLAAGDWHRWNYYAGRVWHIKSCFIPSIDQASWERLGTPGYQGSLLPNLRTFTATVWTATPFSCLLQQHLIESPNLTDANLTLRAGSQWSDPPLDWGDVEAEFLPTLQSLSPQLRHFALTIYTPHDFTISLLSIVPSLCSLTRLDLGHGIGSRPLLEALGSLVGLEHLNIAQSWTVDGLGPSLPATSLFPSLHSLSAPPGVACLILKGCVSSITKVEILEGWLPPTDVANVFRGIVQGLVRLGQALTSVSWMVAPGLPETEVAPSILVPLMECRTIVAFRVSGFPPPTNSQVRRFGSAWKENLRAFSWKLGGTLGGGRLMAPYFSPIFPLPSLDAILAIARRCTSLEEIAIPIDSRSGHVLGVQSRLDCLTMFDVSQWIIDWDSGSHDTLYRVLRQLVPLDSITGWEGPGIQSQRFRFFQTLIVGPVDAV